MVWQVWVNGPTSEALKLKLAGESFPVILGYEIWDVIASDFVDELIDIFYLLTYILNYLIFER